MPPDGAARMGEEEDSDRPDQFCVAIVGAGFAGLVLANYLANASSGGLPSDDATTGSGSRQQQLQERPPPNKWSYELFEAKAQPIAIIGTIRLPSARDLLVQGLICLDDGKVFVDEERNVISREAFLEALRRHVTIRYSCRVVRVTGEMGCCCPPRRRKRFFVETDSEQRYGPFDLVVAADGLFGLLSLGVERGGGGVAAGPGGGSGSGGIARIGDGRWQDRLWWDFGTTRIRRGGDIAIQDALKLGELLVTRGGHDLDLGKFEAPSDYELSSRRFQKRLLLIVLCSTFVAILYGRILQFERI